MPNRERQDTLNQEMNNWKNPKFLGISIVQLVRFQNFKSLPQQLLNKDLCYNHVPFFFFFLQETLHFWKECIQACAETQPMTATTHVHCMKSQRRSSYSATHHLPLWSLLLEWHTHFDRSPSSEILSLNTIYCSLAPMWYKSHFQ